MILAEAALLAMRMRLEQRDCDRLAAAQQKALKRLLSNCAADVPHYRGIGNSGLERLRPTLKDELRDSPQSFLANGAGSGLETIRTSGSTGIPVSILQTSQEKAHCLALEMYQHREAGLSPSDVQAKICYYSLPPGLLQRMGIYRRHYIPVQDSIESMGKRLFGIRPSVLHGYPSILAPLANLNLEDGKKLGFRLVFSSAETLTAGARKTIIDSFGCDLRDIYGSTETSYVAWQCEKGSMHVHPSVIVEIADDEGQTLGEGEEGNILITPLWKRTMPLLRYRVGDRGTLGGLCPCGRGLQTLATISGREDDVLTLPSGRKVSARAINLMDGIPGIREYQIVQESRERLVFRYRPASGTLSPALKDEISKRIQKGCLGEEVEIKFEEVKGFERNSRGKLRTIISKTR